MTTVEQDYDYSFKSSELKKDVWLKVEIIPSQVFEGKIKHFENGTYIKLSEVNNEINLGKWTSNIAIRTISIVGDGGATGKKNSCKVYVNDNQLTPEMSDNADDSGIQFIGTINLSEK